jgi:hypothetical protein
MAYIEIDEEAYQEFLDEGLDPAEAIWEAATKDEEGNLILFESADEEEGEE